MTCPLDRLHLPDSACCPGLVLASPSPISLASDCATPSPSTPAQAALVCRTEQDLTGPAHARAADAHGMAQEKLRFNRLLLSACPSFHHVPSGTNERRDCCKSAAAAACVMSYLLSRELVFLHEFVSPSRLKPGLGDLLEEKACANFSPACCFRFRCCRTAAQYQQLFGPVGRSLERKQGTAGARAA